MTELTREQARAVASRAHALVIRAGAGTGKTTTLAHRIARLAGEGTPEHRMLAVTFTREATVSLARRIGILRGKSHGVRVASFHQWAAREMRDDEPRYLDASDATRILLDALRRRRPGLGFQGALGGGEDIASRVAGFLSYVKNAETTVGDAILRQFPALTFYQTDLEWIHDHYQARKGDRLDYDDVLLVFRDRLAREASFRAEVAGRIDHLAVDEFQDVNRAQADAVSILAKRRGGPDVTVVGDPRQSIYAFRGASPNHLDTFLEPFGRRGSQVALTVNFRATRALVAAGNAALPDDFPLRARPRAQRGVGPVVLGCDDGEAEARAAVDHVATLLREGAQPDDVIVLCRARNLAARYADEVRARGLDASTSARVSTIHAAKGLEWDHVVLVGAREGGLPSEHALRAAPESREALISEEQRLFYVAVTRARKSLLVTWTRTPSRFLATGPVLGEKGGRKEAAPA